MADSLEKDLTGKGYKMKEKLTISKALEILYNHEDILGGHDDYWKAYCFIEKQLKALEIIKDCCIVAKYPNNTYELSFAIKKTISKEDYEILKKVLL